MPSAPGIPNPQDRILELADGGRIELAGGSVAKSTKNKLIDDFLKEELKNNKGKITNQSSVDLAKKFNDKYPNKNFYFNGELSPVDHKSIHYRISNNPDFKKNITLIIGRRTDPVYEDKINKAIEVYKKLPEEQKRALKTGGVGHTGALDKFMEENDLFRESSKYGSKMNQKAMDKTLFGRKLNEAGVERPEAIPQEENIKNQKLRRKEIIGDIGSTGYEKHIENFKRKLQDYLGIEKSKLLTGKKMFPLELAHRTDIDQLYALNQKMDPSDLGIDYYKINREGYKGIEIKLSDLYDEQNKLYKQAKKLDKVPESLSKKIFLNNDEILQTIGESPFKDRLKPITINPVTLEVKRGSVITDDITKQLGIGLVDKPMNKIKIGSKDDAIIKLNLAQQVVDEANRIGLIKDVDSARKAANEFVVGKPLSNKSLPLYTFPAQLAEAETILGPMSKLAKTGASTYGNLAGGPYGVTIGAVINADELINRGWDIPSALLFGAGKFLTQDTLNFFLHDIPKARSGVRDTLNEMKEKGETLDDVNFMDFWKRVGEKMGPAPVNIADKAKEFIEEKVMDPKKTLDKMIDLRTRKVLTDVYGAPSVTDTEVPDAGLDAEYNKIKNLFYKDVMKNPEVKAIIEKDVPKQTSTSTGPFYLGTEQTQEFAIGGRAKFASGSDDPESDLYIPPLNEKTISGTNMSKEGINGLYFRFKEEPRTVPIDPVTGEPITSGRMKELKQVFSSLLSNEKPQIGFANDNFNLNASKGINPYSADRSIKYEANYRPEGDLGMFSLEKTPQYLSGNYTYDKDGLNYGISGLVDKMGNKNIQARIKYNFAKGGLVKKWLNLKD